MSYRGMKRLLGETNFELKSLVLFGLGLTSLATITFALYWWQTSGLVEEGNRQAARQLIPPIILALVVRDTATVVWVIVTYATINLLVGNVIEPRVMGKGLGLSTLIVFLSLVFWGFILGPVGMLLSVPLTVIAKIILDASDETRWISILLSSEAPTVKEIHEVA